MFKIVSKAQNEYRVLDTSDNSVEVCTLAEMKNFCNLGIDVIGTVKLGNKLAFYSVAPSILDGFRLTKRYDVDTSDGYKVIDTEILTGFNRKPLHLEGYKMIDSSRRLEFMYLGDHNSHKVCEVIEEPVYGYSRGSYLSIHLLALFNDKGKIKCYLNQEGYTTLSTRTRTSPTSNTVYVDMYSKKNSAYFKGVFRVLEITEQLCSIFILKNGDIFYFTRKIYYNLNREDDTEFEKYSYHMYEFKSGEVDRQKYTQESLSGMFNLPINPEDIERMYGSVGNNFSHLQKHDLADFIDDMSK